MALTTSSVCVSSHKSNGNGAKLYASRSKVTEGGMNCEAWWINISCSFVDLFISFHQHLVRKKMIHFTSLPEIYLFMTIIIGDIFEIFCNKSLRLMLLLSRQKMCQYLPE